MNTSDTVLYIVIPCYKEEEVLPETAKRLRRKLDDLSSCGSISEKSRIVFVNDGSTDKTWDIITELHKIDNVFRGIDLSCNRGHQNALLAGLMTVKDEADVVISMDADLQDDINAIDQMLEKHKDGCDIVYGVRSSRKTDTRFKRFTAQTFYKFMNYLGAKTIYNHADYRLMSKRALNELSGYKEVNLFLRGMIPLIGLKSDIVYYERGERFAGESKYPLKKMLSLSVEGITSFSVKPMNMITGLGIAVFLASIVMLIYVLIRHFSGHTVAGWSSIIISIWAIGGLILFALGIVGSYIGKIYLETKERPRYIVREYLKNDK